MSGIICAICGNASNEPRHPKCSREDCPGNEVFLHMTPKPDACEHQWDGPYVDIENGTSITCSKCGMSAYQHSLMSGW